MMAYPKRDQGTTDRCSKPFEAVSHRCPESMHPFGTHFMELECRIQLNL